MNPSELVYGPASQNELVRFRVSNMPPGSWITGQRHPCIVCEKVGEKENGVQCEICDKWWHAACAGLRQEEYTVVQESAIKDEQVLHWHGPDCNKNAVGVLTLWTPDASIPALRKLPYAVKRRYTVGTVYQRHR